MDTLGFDVCEAADDYFRRGQPIRLPKAEDVFHKLGVSLEDLYNGCVRKVEIKKSVVCNNCRGRGTTKQSVTMVWCLTCQGKGFRVNPLHLRKRYRYQSNCKDCCGQGERFAPNDRCTYCDGKRVVFVEKLLEVNVGKGMVDRQVIKLSGEGNQELEHEPGDLIVVLNEMKHHTYTRSGSDLILKLKIELVEALCGFKKVIKTLDDRSLVVTVTPGNVLKPGAVKYVMNEGMPTKCDDPLKKGRMVIEFLVNIELPVNKIAQLESLLPAKPVVTLPDIAEVVTLMKMDPNQCNVQGLRTYNI